MEKGGADDNKQTNEEPWQLHEGGEAADAQTPVASSEPDPDLVSSKRQNKISDSHLAIVQESAREIVAGADLIEKPTRYKTLYYGLKLNHVRNVAIVHPLMFTLRRVLYALTIVLMPNWPLIGTWILLIGTLVMLGYALVEW